MAGVGPLCKVAYSKGMAPGLVARVVIVCAVLVTAGTAAAERRKVAVIDLSAEAPARKLVLDLYNVLLNHPDLQPLGNAMLDAALQNDFVDEDGPHIARAHAFKQDAENYLAQVDDDAAARYARDGMRELARVTPTSAVLGLYAELAFAHGQAQIGLRNPNDASLAFQLAHRLDPARRPDPTRFPPNIVQAYNAAANKPTIPAKLDVVGEGRVWIDGIELGPAGTYETSEGLHLVQLSGPDRETRGEQVLVPQAPTIAIGPARASDELKVKRIRLALAKARDATERAREMKRLAKQLGIGDAVLISKGGSGGKLMVQTWRDNEDGFSRPVDLGTREPIDLLTPLAPPRKPEPKDPIIVVPPITEEPRWHQRRWVRASIAGAVILGAATAIWYAQRDRFLPMPNPEIQTAE